MIAFSVILEIKAESIVGFSSFRDLKVCSVMRNTTELSCDVFSTMWTKLWLLYSLLFFLLTTLICQDIPRFPKQSD